MRNFILTLILLTSFFSCNTYKKAQKDIYSGNFDQALDNMIKKYSKGNIKDKDIARWTETFNTAYAKANAQNIDEIYQAQYASESSNKYRHILANYVSMQSRYGYCPKKCVKFKLTDFCVEPKKHRKNELYTRTNVRNI